MNTVPVYEPDQPNNPPDPVEMARWEDDGGSTHECPVFRAS